MYLELKILTKNKKSINKFLLFFFNNNKLNLIFKHFSKKNKRKIFTILKAPHVNKIAQEQFEYRIVTNQTNLYILKTLKFLVFLKNIQNKLFSNIKLELNTLFWKKNDNIKIEIFNPDKFRLNYKTKNYISKYKYVIEKKNLKKNIYRNFHPFKKPFKYVWFLQTYMGTFDLLVGPHSNITYLK
jgi:hypothetical protein